MGSEHESTGEKESGLFPEPQPSSSGTKGRWGVIAAIVAAIVVVTTVAIAGGSRAPQPAAALQPAAAPEQVAQEPPARPEAPREQPPAPDVELVVLATVNGQDITSVDLAQHLQTMPAQMRVVYEQDQAELLEMMVMRAVLLQEVERLGRTEEAETPGPAAGDAAIQWLIVSQVPDVEVSEEDLRAFYEAHKAELQGDPSFEDVRQALMPHVERETQRAARVSYMDGLREKAEVTFNEPWVAEQKARTADNPLDRALKTGRPVLVEFGSKNCPPCEQMRPTMEELMEEYRGRAEIIIVDTAEHPALAWRHAIQFTPTLLFYDAAGEQIGRQVGYMAREQLVARLTQMGVE